MFLNLFSLMYSDDGLIFTDLTIITNRQGVNWFDSRFPNATEVLSQIENQYRSASHGISTVSRTLSQVSPNEKEK